MRDGMKDLLLTDLHGHAPVKLIRRYAGRTVDRVICLGDFDNPQILEYLLDIDLDKIIVLGNHDYCHARGEVLGGMPRNMGAMSSYLMWLKCKRARDFVLDKTQDIEAVDDRSGLRVITTLGGRNILYVHGLLAGHPGDDPTLSCYIWGRLFPHTNAKLEINFVAMLNQNFWMMVRGHDDFATIWSLVVEGSEAKMTRELTGLGKLKLDMEKHYIVSLGSFLHGHFALMDRDKLTIEFKQLRHK